MSIQQIFTALLFYLPFLLTIVFGLFTLILGLFAIFSGTLIVLVFAAYGFYAFLRDSGLLEKTIEKLKSIWQWISHDVEWNLQQSFVFRNPEKLPSTTALFLCHPHGLIGYSWMLHFCYGISEWSTDKPKPVVAIHSILFRIPFVRDVLEQCRCIEAKEETIREYLNKGVSVAIVTGGIEEMTHNGEATVKVVLKKRKGYARIAKDSKVPIVTLFTVGENELFPNETFWLWRNLSTLIRKWTSLHVPLPSWKSMKQWAMIVRKPLENPVETFVLDVIDTQKKDEQTIRKECVSSYKHFFKTKNIQGRIIA